MTFAENVIQLEHKNRKTTTPFYKGIKSYNSKTKCSKLMQNKKEFSSIYMNNWRRFYVNGFKSFEVIVGSVCNWWTEDRQQYTKIHLIKIDRHIKNAMCLFLFMSWSRSNSCWQAILPISFFRPLLWNKFMPKI